MNKLGNDNIIIKKGKVMKGRISDIETNIDKILSEREDCKLFVEAAVDNAVNTIGYRASCFLKSLFNFTEKSH